MRTKVERWMLACAAIVVLGACVEIAGIEEAHPEDNRWANWPMPNPPSTGLPNPASYTVDATNDVVTDNVTGLIWQRTVDVTKDYTWDEAKTYCNDLTLGGFTDWRLPSRIELVSIVDYTRENPPIDMDAFPATPSDPFWTFSPVAGTSPLQAWYVSFLLKGVTYTDKVKVTQTHRVRCVR